MSQQITSSNLVPATESKNIVMNVLTLIIKKKWLDEILSGEKTTEEREIRPKTIKKYATIVDLATGKSYDNYDDLFAEVKPNDKGFDFVPRKYDALQLYAGYETGDPASSSKLKVQDVFLSSMRTTIRRMGRVQRPERTDATHRVSAR